MRILPWLAAGTLLASAGSSPAQQDPGKEVVGRIMVEVYYATDGEPEAAGDKTQAVSPELAQRLQREKSTHFKHYLLLGSDTKELYRSYENWAEPVKPSDEIMVRFEAQSHPGPKAALLDLELWLARKKIVKTDVRLTAEKPLWVRGPTWRKGHLIIAVSLLSVDSAQP